MSVEISLNLTCWSVFWKKNITKWLVKSLVGCHIALLSWAQNNSFWRHNAKLKVRAALLLEFVKKLSNRDIIFIRNKISHVKLELFGRSWSRTLQGFSLLSARAIVSAFCLLRYFLISIFFKLSFIYFIKLCRTVNRIGAVGRMKKFKSIMIKEWRSSLKTLGETPHQEQWVEITTLMNGSHH